MLSEALFDGVKYGRRHLSLSRATLTETAEIALDAAEEGTPSRALILGAGNCTDIPLDFIAPNFDEIVLVDADIAATERAVRHLPPYLLGKISLVGADVTGIIPSLSASIEQAVGSCPTFDQFVPTVVQSLSTINPDTSPKPNLGDGFNFVCSQLLMSQLCLAPLTHMAVRQIPQHYGKTPSIADIESEDELYRATDLLEVATQLSHISYLRRLVATNGTVHLADTYELDTIETAERQQRVMLDPAVFQPHIDQLFNSLAPATSWKWTIGPARTFSVTAHSLAPRVEV